MQVFWPWSSLRMSACTVPRTFESTHSRILSASSSVGSRPLSARNLSICWSSAVLKNIARITGAGPLMVIDTEVVGRTGRSPSTAPSCRRAWRWRRRSCRPCRRCPAAGPVAAVQRHRVEGRRQAVRRHALGDLLEARLVRKASPSPANMRVGSSFSRLKANTPAVYGKEPGTFSFMRKRRVSPSSSNFGSTTLRIFVPDSSRGSGRCALPCRGSSRRTRRRSRPLHVGPHLEQLLRARSSWPSFQVISSSKWSPLLAAALEQRLGRAQALPLAGKGRLLGECACGSRAPCRRCRRGSARARPARWRGRARTA
jgi:hypothetical protein